MSNINYNLYKIFCAVANSKSYADAGVKLNLSTSNISMQITNLEKQLDVKLFNREKDGVKLTEAGEELYAIINQGISSFDFAEKVIKQKNDLANGTIYIGCPSHLTNYYLIELIEKAKEDYPNLNIKLVCSANSEEMLDLLKNHKLDFLIMDVIPTDDKDIIVENLKTINNIFVSKEPLKINNIKELEELKYILNFDYTITTQKLMKVLNENGVLINANMECDTTEIRVSCAKRGLGISYVMKEAVKEELTNKELFEVELPIQLPSLSINLIYIKNQLSKVDKSFIRKYLKNKE